MPRHVRRPLAERFWQKVDKSGGPDECWPWRGHRKKDGYGTIDDGGAGGKTLSAHRVAWSLKNGPVPDGVDIRHTCNSRSCCNEAHLSAVPHAVNITERNGRPRRHHSLAERFWKKVDVRGPDECWPWLACRDSHGYGQISKGAEAGDRVPSGAYKKLIASRVAWELVNGPIPDGMDVCHSCDNPPCCNPAHLSPAPTSFNIADMVAKRRGLVGEASGHAKLTAAQVLEIRAAPGSQREIAVRFGINQSTVSDIKRGKRWKHLPPSGKDL